jgi:hypothetical protein
VGLVFRFIDERSQFFPRRKVRHAPRVNLHGFAGSGVATSLSSAGTSAKRPETPDVSTSAVSQVLGDAVEEHSYSRFDLAMV